MDAAIRDLKDFALTELCGLNNAHAVETSFLTEAGMSRLIEMSFYARGFSGPDALLLALDETASYDNANFRYFFERYERFVYVDRLITADTARRKGLGRRLYEEMFQRAKASGRRLIGCEVNVDPPNVVSDHFHAQLGFEEVGRTHLENGKTVRYLLRTLV